MTLPWGSFLDRLPDLIEHLGGDQPRLQLSDSLMQAMLRPAVFLEQRSRGEVRGGGSGRGVLQNRA